jgi:hypothetical protein
MKRPRPAMLRLHLADDVVQEMARAEGQSWQDMADSIAAMEPLVVEVIDKDGKLLRAIKPQEEDQDGRRVRDNRQVPLPPALHTDPETARICFTADLLHRAYQHATDVSFEQCQKAYSEAFGRLIDLVERIDSRSTAIETRLERTERAYQRSLQDQIDDAFDRAEEAGAAAAAASTEGDFETMMVKSFMGGMQTGRAEKNKPPQPPKPNGKAST